MVTSMSKRVAILYLLVFLAGVVGGVCLPSSFYAGPASTPTHASVRTAPVLAGR
jgi:hypothetical protein